MTFKHIKAQCERWDCELEVAGKKFWLSIESVNNLYYVYFCGDLVPKARQEVYFYTFNEAREALIDYVKKILTKFRDDLNIIINLLPA